MNKTIFFLLCNLMITSTLLTQELFNGLYMNMGNLPQLSNAKTRSISPENFTGEKGKGGTATLEEGTAAKAARDLGQGWKVNPYIYIEPNTTFTLAKINESGAIQQIWMTPTGNWRFIILRIYWDGEKKPSVEVPVGDFFGVGWEEFKQISSMPVCVNPGRGFNCYWVMPFRKSCKITMENIGEERMKLYYQINYTITNVPEDVGYFHAQFRRTNPLKYKDVYTIIDGINGKGHFVGTCMAWQTNNNGWWGEGEIKFYMDDDDKFPTICGTGTEDYFCGAYCFSVKNKKTGKREEYTEYTTPHAGFYVIEQDGFKRSQTRFGLYRWHIMDPVRFEKNLKITIQAIGWRSGRRYLPLQDDIASVAYWYQTEPHTRFPPLPGKDDLEVQ
jgi:hypothetical protein